MLIFPPKPEGHFMKYLRSDLLQEYNRFSTQYPDIEDLSTPLMNISDVLRAYFILADYFSDPTATVAVEKMLIGIRDMNLLASALGRQKASFGNVTKYKNPLDICSTLFYGLVKNHAFSDGNKRTALLTLLYQLDCYGYFPKANQKEFEKLVIAVASNDLENNYSFRKLWRHAQSKDYTDRCVEVISQSLKRMTEKKSASFHMDITARDLVHAFNSIEGCICYIDETKIRIQRTIIKSIHMWKKTEELKTYTIPYRGMTRIIGAATIREALEVLQMYDQFPSYRTFFEDTDPRYMLIAQFEGPLRRLKDK